MIIERLNEQLRDTPRVDRRGRFQAGDARVLVVPAALTERWPTLTSLEGAPAYNVGRAYAAFAADIDDGTHTVPDFAHAVRRHEVIAAIERSAASGERMRVQAAALERVDDRRLSAVRPSTRLAT